MILAMPGRAEQIRRRFWSDWRFRAVCQDYGEAILAAERFAAQPCQRQAEEFRELADELLAEAARMLRT